MTTNSARKQHGRHSVAPLRSLLAFLATLMLAACSSSSSDGGPSSPPPPPPPPPPPTNTAPMAAAGPDMSVSAKIGVQLDGSASSDADGDPITYAWSFAFVPGGSTAAFDDDTSAQPSFTPDVAGDYTIELVVSDGTTTSSTDEVVITAADNTVTQSIGPAGGQIVSADGIVTLDIPAGALMADEDISITYVPDEQHSSYLGPEFASFTNILTVYDLAPDGLTFNSPISVDVLTGDNPVVDSNTVGGHLHVLYSSDGTSAFPLDSLTVNADADEASLRVQGTLSHFSPLVWTGYGYLRSFDFFLSGVPDQPVYLEQVIVSAGVDSPVYELREAEYNDPMPIDEFAPLFGSEENTPMNRDGMTNNFTLGIDYRCNETGTARFTAGMEIVLPFLQPNADDDFVIDEVWNAYASKILTCIAAPGGSSSS